MSLRKSSGDLPTTGVAGAGDTPDKRRSEEFSRKGYIGKKSWAGEKIDIILTQAPGTTHLLGTKVNNKEWMVSPARPSGTENIYKIMRRLPRTDHLHRILEEGRVLLNDALKISSAAQIPSG